MEAGPFGDPNKLFNSYDMNGNGIMSLAELDRMVKQNDLFESYRGAKATNLAYKRADDKSKKGKINEGYIDKKEFREFLRLLVIYKDAYEYFFKSDLDHDGSITLDELKKGAAQFDMTEEEAEKIFGEIDADGGGKVRFEELCDWYNSSEKLQAKLDKEAAE